MSQRRVFSHDGVGIVLGVVWLAEYLRYVREEAERPHGIPLELHHSGAVGRQVTSNPPEEGLVSGAVDVDKEGVVEAGEDRHPAPVEGRRADVRQRALRKLADVEEGCHDRQLTAQRSVLSGLGCGQLDKIFG